MHNNYWACALEPRSPKNWAHVPHYWRRVPWSLCSATQEATVMRNPAPLTTTREKPAQQRRPSTTQINKENYIFKKWSKSQGGWLKGWEIWTKPFHLSGHILAGSHYHLFGSGWAEGRASGRSYQPQSSSHISAALGTCFHSRANHGFCDTAECPVKGVSGLGWPWVSY